MSDVVLLDDVKRALRVDGQDHDVEILDLIEAAKADLALSGVDPAKAASDTDPLIKRAIILYCRAHFDWDHPNADRLRESYESLKRHLTLSVDYRPVEEG